jgi:hypothetical protein
MRLRRARRGKDLQPGVSDSDADITLAPAESPALSASPGTVLGLRTVAQESAPPINEWGLYDPEVCGFNALLSSLDQAENSDIELTDEEPADLLLRQDEQPLDLQAVEMELDRAPSNGDNVRASSAAAVASCRVPHFAPLALWAHVTSGDTESWGAAREASLVSDLPFRATSRWSPLRLPVPVCDDLAALIGRLTLPAQFVVTSVPGGCRIRDVHVAPATGDDHTEADSPEPDCEEVGTLLAGEPSGEAAQLDGAAGGATEGSIATVVVETEPAAVPPPLTPEAPQSDPPGDALVPSDAPDLVRAQPEAEAGGPTCEIAASEPPRHVARPELPVLAPLLSCSARWTRVAMALG